MRPFLVTFLAVLAIYVGLGAAQATSAYTPMSLVFESLQQTNNPPHHYCAFVETYYPNLILNDDKLVWAAEGSLNPGESFSYTPSMPSCNGENAAIRVQASGSPALRISTTVPAGGDVREVGKPIVSSFVNDKSYLCMFMPQRWAFLSSGNGYDKQPWNYTIIITNTGPTPVDNIRVDGVQENGWINYFYPDCMFSDADQDGFNDSIEEAMGDMQSHWFNPAGETWPYADYQSHICCMYLSPFQMPDPNWNPGAYPPDLNNDGAVNSVDVARIMDWMGKGDGIPLAEISPNYGTRTFWFDHGGFWRRFDLDGDGFVDAKDLNIVQTLVGKPIPMTQDLLAPTVRISRFNQSYSNFPSTVPRGSYIGLQIYAWDNLALQRVEVWSNDQRVCLLTQPNTRPYVNGLYSCGWQIANRPRVVYSIQVKAFDGGGMVGISPIHQVTSQ